MMAGGAGRRCWTGCTVQVRTRKGARTSKQDGRGLQSYEVTKVLVYGPGKASIRPLYYLYAHLAGSILPPGTAGDEHNRSKTPEISGGEEAPVGPRHRSSPCPPREAARADEGQRCDGRKKGSKAVSGPPPRSQSDTSRYWINGGALPFPLLADPVIKVRTTTHHGAVM